MPSKSTKKSALQYLGLGLFAISLLVFTAMLGLDDYKFSEELILDEFSASDDANYWQQDAAAFQQAHLQIAGEETGLFTESFGSTFASEKKLKETYAIAQARVKEYYETEGLPQAVDDKGEPKLKEDGTAELVQLWQVELPNWKLKDKTSGWIKNAATGPVESNPWLFFSGWVHWAVCSTLFPSLPQNQALRMITFFTIRLPVGWTLAGGASSLP